MINITLFGLKETGKDIFLEMTIRDIVYNLGFEKNSQIIKIESKVISYPYKVLIPLICIWSTSNMLAEIDIIINSFKEAKINVACEKILLSGEHISAEKMK